MRRDLIGQLQERSLQKIGLDLDLEVDLEGKVLQTAGMVYGKASEICRLEEPSKA